MHRLFDPDSFHFACTCSVERTRNMLLSLGKIEIEFMLDEQDKIAITCEFCNFQYQFDKVDLVLLFKDSDSQPISPTRH